MVAQCLAALRRAHSTQMFGEGGCIHGYAVACMGALAALLLGFVVASALLVLAAVRGAWRRDLDDGAGERGFHARSVLRLRGSAAVTVGGLIAAILVLTPP